MTTLTKLYIITDPGNTLPPTTLIEETYDDCTMPAFRDTNPPHAYIAAMRAMAQVNGLTCRLETFWQDINPGCNVTEEIWS